jgi:lipoprotein-anchoring transpeptidase ErfK/SrfK
MNNRLAKLQESESQKRMGETAPQGRVRSGQGNPAKGPKKKRSLILPILLIAAGCAVFAFAAWSAVTSPVLASILNIASLSQTESSEPEQSFAQVYLPKPTYTPAMAQPAAAQPTVTFTTVPPTEAPTQVAVIQPTDIPTLQAVDPTTTPTLQPTAEVATSEAVAQAEIVPDTPTPEYVAPTAVANVPPPSGVGSGERWFDVDLSDQRMYAYEGDTLVRTFIVSTGTWQTPTVTGKFKVWIKLRSAPMSGPGYYLPDVPYIMYFHGDYGIHGTYWHNNFGVPMSHGCVNLSIPDAEWAYNFASVGTVVNVHD